MVATIGPYEVLERLGAGGMAEVFLGYDTRLHRKVALKHLNTPEQASDTRSRVLREARAAARLNHPNIASIYDVIEDGDDAVIVMEYVDGESLCTRLAAGPLLPDEVIAIGHQLADAIASAHAQGVIHRDLKPSNVQLTSRGIVKVLDFGVARVVTPPVEQPENPTTTRNDPSLVLGDFGTPHYMAPEQLIGGHADVRSDIYSLGAVLFEMATGRRPYEEADAFALAVAISTLEPPAADSVNPRVPHGLSAVIARALEREPLKRYQSATELAEALVAQRDRSDEPTLARSNLRGGASKRRRVAAAGWALIVLALVVVPLLLRLPSTRRGPTTAGAPAVVAVLPVDNRAGDARGDAVGAGLASVIAANFGSVSGLTVLPMTATEALRDRPTELPQASRSLGITYLVVLTIRAVAPTTVIDATLRRSDTATDVWSRTVRGDLLTVERLLLDQLGRALNREGAFRRTLSTSEWARINKLPTSSPEALQAYSEGRALLDRYDVAGNVDHAIRLFRRAAGLDAQFATAFAALGEALWKQYTVDKRPEIAASAAAAVTRALTLDGDLVPIYYALGLMQSETGHYEEATASLRRALALQPDNDETHRLLGRVLATLGDYPSAITELQRAISLRPIWTNYYSLGFVLYSSGNYSGARDAFKKTAELQPTFSDAYQMLGTVYHMMGDLPQAIGSYEHAVRLGTNAAAYANLGLAYYAAKQFEQARQAYSDAVARQPRKASLHKSLGDVYLRLGRAVEARMRYEQAMTLAGDDLKVNPRDAFAVILLGTCEAKLGRRVEADRHAAEATMLAPSNRDIWIRVAKLYTALHERRPASHAVQTAVALGYEPNMIAGDDELEPLGPILNRAVQAGLAARATKGAAR